MIQMIIEIRNYGNQKRIVQEKVVTKFQIQQMMVNKKQILIDAIKLYSKQMIREISKMSDQQLDNSLF